MHAQHIDFLDLLDGQVQYVVPRWQRRYRWGQADIERLVEDLLTVAVADPQAAHYGGTLLTFPEPGPAGVVKTIRVVDGQQRLTTVSILLACIAEALGHDGQCGDWTAQIIRDDRLTNPGKPPEKRRKLRLQHGDDDEYRLGLQGTPTGAGAVSQAWRIARRLVARNDVTHLFEGLKRLRVVSIGLEQKEDPQQIFESLNATGRPLTESEKVKNWLLMGLPDAEQQDLHDNHWLRIERTLGAEHTTEPTDVFLRDVLRWRTGEIQGIDRVYEGLRRWAVREGHAENRPALCRDLARLARLYGTITGTAEHHRNRKVERELRHLRAMRIDVHRPLTLRLLSDASAADESKKTDEALAKVLAGIGTWTTRMWLAERPMAGMNKAAAEFAHGPGPGVADDYVDYWLGRLQRLRNTRVGVPGDEEIREGIRTRKAYGGSATQSAFAVLCELMEAEHGEESPARDRLTIEHVMPQKLTDEWKRSLGDDAEEIHGRHRDRLPNLTLSGDVTNIVMGTGTLAAKREVYRKSSMGITRSLADETEWNEDALERRSNFLARRALDRWPWPEQRAPARETEASSAKLRWRIEDDPWRVESTASQMVLHVAAALLSQDATNAQRLSGEAISSNVHLASRYPPNIPVGTLTLRAVPGHEQYVLYPYDQDYPTSAERCRKMGERCGVAVKVEFEENTRAQAFWKLFKEREGGVPGQKNHWRGASQWTSPLNSAGDRVGIYVGHPERLWLYIRAGERQPSARRAARMRACSFRIREEMGDQLLGENLEKNSADGITITVQTDWIRDDDGDWPDAAQWIKEQFERLRSILLAISGEATRSSDEQVTGRSSSTSEMSVAPMPTAH
ncbi:MAG: DUF262 domain-containing protein [Rhodospirillales bacterium]|nr:DUF262 domain-containing protein [Rhodospirillales bacterium]